MSVEQETETESPSNTQLSPSEIDEIVGRRFIVQSLTPGTLLTRLQVWSFLF